MAEHALKAHNAKINTQVEFNENSLFYGYVKLTKFCNRGDTALHMAMRQSPEVARVLILAGAKTNIPNASGTTADDLDRAFIQHVKGDISASFRTVNKSIRASRVYN